MTTSNQILLGAGTRQVYLDPRYANPDLDTVKSITELGVGEALLKSMVRSVGNQLDRQLLRGILGSLKR